MLHARLERVLGKIKDTDGAWIEGGSFVTGRL